MGVVDFCKIETRDDLFSKDHLPKLLLPGPLLRQISVDGCSRRGFNTVPLTGDFPSLESLHIHRFPMPISNLHAPNLRSLKLVGELDLEDLLALFESSPLLERLHFRVELYRNVSAGARRNIVLEKVKQAKFCLDAFKILQYLLLPASNEIVINISGTQGNYTQLLSQALDGFPMCRQVQSMSFPSEGPQSIRFTQGPKRNTRTCDWQHPQPDHHPSPSHTTFHKVHSRTPASKHPPLLLHGL